MPTTVTRRDNNGDIISEKPLRLNQSRDSGNDADTPAYLSIAYQKAFPHVELCCDAYEGSSAWVIEEQVTDSNKAARYLPKESQEQSEQYTNRILRSLFANSFKAAVRGFAGLLSDFEVSDDAAIAEWLDDVDLQGSSLKAFLCDADEMVLRDGMCGILVDYPESPEIENAEQEQALGLRPYLVLIERKDILNWRHSAAGMLEQVTVRRMETRPEGLFGEKEVTTYHVWMPGIKQVWEEVENDGDVSVVLINEMPITPLTVVPLVPYSVTALTPFASMPPLLDLAKMNFHHYRLYSDYMEVMHKCNLPVPVRKGYMPAGTVDGAALPPVVIGPNTAIDVPADGDFNFAEPSGAAIGATRQALIDLEERMMQESLNFLGNTGMATATEVQLRSSQSRASLSLLAEQKESAVQKIFAIWAEWIGVEEPGSIQVSRSLMQEKLEAAMVNILSQMQSLGQLPLQDLLDILQKGQVIPRTIDIEEIAQRVNPLQDEALGL